MTFPIEIVLRERDQAITTQIVVPSDPRAGERTPGEWTDADVEDALKQMLLAIDRVRNPAADQRYVALRGFSWIVEPSGDGGVVIAIEIPSGAAVAGPFAVEQTVLDGRIARLVAAARVPRPVVH
jgi:hypothetical protein